MERSIMIQYTGTSSRSNYNDERTATIGRPSELLRRLGVGSRPVFHLLSCSPPHLAPPHHRVDFLLLSLLFLDPLSPRSPLAPLALFLFPSSSSSSSSSSSCTFIEPPVAAAHSTATRANISSGSSRGHGVTVDESLSRSSGIITGATARVHLAGSASSAEYVLDETIGSDESLGERESTDRE